MGKFFKIAKKVKEMSKVVEAIKRLSKKQRLKGTTGDVNRQS